MPGGLPLQPWAAAVRRARGEANSKDNPDAHCLPMGIMQMDSHPYPKKIIQTPTEVLIIYEASGNPLIGETAQPHWQHLRRVMAAALSASRSMLLLRARFR